MIEVIGISFKDGGRIYYFLPGQIEPKKNHGVIVETEKGFQYGKIVTDILKVDESKLNFPLKNIIRIASDQDIIEYEKNQNMATKAIEKTNSLIEKYNLEMKIIEANFTFDRKQLVIYFLSDKRVDFRSLAKELANIYKTRIELRQIGVRDKAKEVGGYGTCGQSLCCSKFMSDFDTISINMAKNQNIALNPNKINGVCGRLLCCLKYEDETYKEMRKDLPRIGNMIKTEKGEGKVISVDVISKKCRVLVPDSGIVEIDRK